jgi:hypothetical protein
VKNSRSWWLYLSITILCVIAFFLLFGERLLVIQDSRKVANVDAVVVLAGDKIEDPARVKAGLVAFHERHARYLFLPVRYEGMKWKWLCTDYHIKASVPSESLVIGQTGQGEQEIQAHYGSTYLEALKTVKFMSAMHLRSVVVVSSGYHLRRARYTFHCVGVTKGMDISFSPAEVYPAGTILWWTDWRYAINVLVEYRKLLGAILVY